MEDVDLEVEELRAAADHADKRRDPDEWAAAHFRLAVAYLERVVWGALADARPAIEAFQKVLEVWTPVEAPRNWSRAAFNLGTCYLLRPDGDRSADIELCIGWYRRALRVTRRREWTQHWARIVDGLGQAYRQRIAGDPARNRDRALCYFRLALRARPAEVDLIDHAKTRVNIANAYLDRVRGEPTDNVELAIQHLTAALAALSPHRDTSQEHADTLSLVHQALGLAYRIRPVGDPERDRREAISHLESALAIRGRSRVPHRWADSMINLGSICLAERFRASAHRPRDVERAIECARGALEVLRLGEQPVRWATAKYLLGLGYLERHAGDPAANVREAIRHLRGALHVRTRARNPLDWADVTEVLGNAYAKLPGDSVAERRAVACYRRALEVYTAELAFERRRTLADFGHFLFERARWREALAVYERAVEAGVALAAEAYTAAGRRAEVSHLSRIYPNAAYCLLRLGRPDAALTLLEEGKARLLGEALGLADAALARLSDDARAGIRTLRETIRGLEAELSRRLASWDAAGTDHARDELRRAREALGTTLAALRSGEPELLPAPLRPAELLHLVRPGECLVAPLLTAMGGAVFLLFPGQEQVGPADVLWIEAGELFELLRPGQVWRPGAPDESRTWLQDYVARRAETSERTRTEREAALDQLLAMLWAVLIGPVHDRLEGTETEELVILPQGGLQLLPLHAAWRDAGGERRYLMDDYRVRYAPSAFVLRECQARAEDREFGRTLVAAVRTYADPRLRPLRYAGVEAAGVAAVTGGNVLADWEATAAAVLARAGSCSHLHFACHATTATDPLHAALQLGARDTGVRDELPGWRIIAELDLARARLVTLAACESGVVDHVLSPDEYVGLPGALLQAGSASVISSLWAVHDLACALLWPAFYERHVRRGDPPAAALRAAQLWLRDLGADEAREIASGWRERGFRRGEDLEALTHRTGGRPPFAHPAFWGAFTCTGA
ncbi:MAG TPA: CHAT domain-containing protein [Longimicrobium sp.]|uniref:CHAT domain-containing protein n=1 Tax=Longimicrobium sp. TaxID=2029185 RepID=UPI002ED91F9D